MSWPASAEDYKRLAEVLRELVGGRRDVAARYFEFMDGERVVRGWQPWKGKRVGRDYQPEAGEAVWAGKDFKTGHLERRVLRPLSTENLITHLRGKERLGVYVLDKDSRCSFLAADFDDHGGTLDPDAIWAEVKRFYDACDAHDWRAHIERSKSGKGFHVWLFFDAPIEAAKARAIGRWLFEESQAIREGEDFSTFDRFFPAQSRLPPGAKGYGNLIGLPLSGPKDYEVGRCAWVHPDSRKHIGDPLAYTLAILERGRNAAPRVDEFIAEWDLSIDEPGADGGEYTPRDPDRPLGSKDEFEATLSRCAFLRWASDPAHQAAIKEPLWYSMVSNACRFEVDDWIHQASNQHPGYSSIETGMKIDHARESSGPHRCAKIAESGYTGCPEGGCKLPDGKPAAAPAGLAAWAHVGEKPRRGRGNRTVSVSPEEARRGEGGSYPEEREDWPDGIPLYPETGQPWPQVTTSWDISNDGVIHRTERGSELIVGRPLWVDALTRNTIGTWGVRLRFFDFDWQYKTWALPRDRLHEQGGALGRELAALGLPVIPGKEKWVSRFIVLQEGMVDKRIRAAGRLGWFDSAEQAPVFVMPEQVIGQSREEIVYQPDAYTPAAETLHWRGTLAEWQQGVAAQCRGNPVLMFGVMVALAGPLLKPCQEQSGGFHLYGTTTGGKTTTAQCAASVWGCGADPQEGAEVTSIRKWYSTGNALESVAELHNDTLLPLDEISEVDPQELGRIIYQLAGGLAKGRSNASGGLRAQKSWRLMFLSTGEKSVRQMLGQVGQEAKGGQRVRMPDIPADDTTTGQRSIVVDAHGREAKDFVQDLKAACSRVYGLAGPTFTGYLIAQAMARGWSVFSGDLREELRQLEKQLAMTNPLINRADPANKPIEMAPEERRVLRRLALVALAGTHALHAGIVDWSLGEILQAVTDIRDRWLTEQGEEKSEADRGLAHLRGQLIAQADRIRPIDSNSSAYRNIVGFRSTEYYMLTEQGLRELAGEFDVRNILNHLKTAGHLWHDSGRLTRKSPKIEGYGNHRLNLYWISLNFMGRIEVSLTQEDQAVRKPEAGPQPPQGRLLADDEKIPY